MSPAVQIRRAAVADDDDDDHQPVSVIRITAKEKNF